MILSGFCVLCVAKQNKINLMKLTRNDLTRSLHPNKIFTFEQNMNQLEASNNDPHVHMSKFSVFRCNNHLQAYIK